jgi:hypothetical protein
MYERLVIVQSDNIIIQRLYGTMVDKANNAIVNTWAHKVKSLLDNNGLSYVWYNPRSVNLQTFHFLFKQRILDIFMQDWSESISNANSLSL